jgi:hypothetical protein
MANTPLQGLLQLTCVSPSFFAGSPSCLAKRPNPRSTSASDCAAASVDTGTRTCSLRRTRFTTSNASFKGRGAFSRISLMAAMVLHPFVQPVIVTVGICRGAFFLTPRIIPWQRVRGEMEWTSECGHQGRATTLPVAMGG